VATIDSTNYEKFRTRNPIVVGFIDRFYETLRSMVESIRPASVLDAGCGEGETVARLAGSLPPRVAGVDVRDDCVSFIKRRFPRIEASRQSVYQLAFPDRSYELVLCLEVLEHLGRPDAALTELARVTERDLLLSVPHEPWFRLGSLLRGKHLRSLGNHPEHMQHWNRDSFGRFLASEVQVVSVATAFPWLIAHCRPRPSSG